MGAAPPLYRPLLLLHKGLLETHRRISRAKWKVGDW